MTRIENQLVDIPLNKASNKLSNKASDNVRQAVWSNVQVKVNGQVYEELQVTAQFKKFLRENWGV